VTRAQSSCETGFRMDDWDLKRVAWRPHQPEILSSTEAGRAIVIDLPAGEILQDHQVHESAWITVISGGVRITDHTGEAIDAQPGSLAQFPPRERHEVTALADSRLLLLLTPWPGSGHPGTMTLEQKADVRGRAADRAR
jgi:quercetin dioxygenase-like cupin family protein